MSEENKKLIEEALQADKRIARLEEEIAYLKNKVIVLNGIEKDSHELKEKISYLEAFALSKSPSNTRFSNRKFIMVVTGISSGTILATIGIIWGIRLLFGV